MIRDAGEQGVQQDGTCEWPSVNAHGFALHFVGRPVGGYPLTVVLDGDAATKVQVLGPHMEMQPRAFTRVRVLGALPGDTLRLMVAETPDDLRRMHLPTNREGLLMTRGGGGRVLFELDPQKRPESTTLANSKAGISYLNPNSSGGMELSNTPGEPWDIGTFSALRFSYRQMAPPNAPIRGLRFFAELYDHPGVIYRDDGQRSALEDEPAARQLVPMGTLNNFATPEGGSSDAVPRHGHILLGAAEHTEGPSFVRTADVAPWVRFLVQVEGTNWDGTPSSWPNAGGFFEPNIFRLACLVW